MRVMGGGQIPHVARALLTLAPPQRYFPDFLTPAASSAGLDAGLDAVLHTPRRRLRAEVAKATGAKLAQGWIRELSDGRPARLRWLAATLRSYFQGALAPLHRQISAHVEAHRCTTASQMLNGGLEATLGNLAPSIRWSPPVLTAHYPTSLDINLAGRGITLVPSFFCRVAPVALADAELDPVLVYPISPPPSWMQSSQLQVGADKHLAALIGQPRTSLLRALAMTPCGTSELSARTGLSMSSTSEHTTVLRNAGMVTSTRRGRKMTHSLTPLGRSVLTGDLST